MGGIPPGFEIVGSYNPLNFHAATYYNNYHAGVYDRSRSDSGCRNCMLYEIEQFCMLPEIFHSHRQR